MRYGYIRTSTGKQLCDRQLLALEAECDRIFIEAGVSAARRKRPVYEGMVAQLKSGDVLVVSSFDRAFRSVIDALLELEKLKAKGVQFVSISQHFDTRTEEGEFMYTMAIALARWERRILSRRTKEGLQAAQARGVKLGRPRKAANG